MNVMYGWNMRCTVRSLVRWIKRSGQGPSRDIDSDKYFDVFYQENAAIFDISEPDDQICSQNY